MARRKINHRWTLATCGILLIGSLGCLPPELAALLDFGFIELGQFSNCGDLETHLKSQALEKAELSFGLAQTGGVYDPVGFKGSVDGAGGSFSETNNQEDGVDEADILEVDERYAYVLHGQDLVIIDGVRGGMPVGDVVSTTTLGGTPFAMYVDGDHAVIMSRTTHTEVKEAFNTGLPDRESDFPTTKATVYDLGDRTAPKLARELFVEGQFIDSRRIGNRVYVVGKALLGGPETDKPTTDSDESWLSDRLAAINGAGLDSWMPYYYDINHTGLSGIGDKKIAQCSCTNTYASDAAPGDETLAVYSFDFIGGDTEVATTTILGDAAQVYASKENLYVALTNYAETTFGDDSFNTEAETGEVTIVHKFALPSSGKVRYESTGQVDGWILDQFSMSEHRGNLRIATQRERGSLDAESMVFVLKDSSKSGESFKTDGRLSNYLKVIGEVRGIGAGEDLYAARFKGDIGYLVTFQETDPLWTIDITSPTKPRVRGFLEVPGWSTYLHPVEGGRLLAVGRGTFGESDGVKLSIFDVGDLDNPTAVDERTLEGALDTEVFNDHHAFRYVPGKQLMALPLTTGAETNMYVYDVSGRSIETVARIDHDDLRDTGSPTMRRMSTIDDYAVLYSHSGVTFNDLGSMDLVQQTDLPDL